MSVSSQATMPVFRTALPTDLVAIEQLLIDAGLPTDGVADIITNRPADFLLAEAADETGRVRVVGVGGLEVCCDNALLRSVAVQRAWQSRAVGRELIRQIVCRAEARGLRALYLLTQTAEHYFPRFGFEQIARDAVPPEIAETLEFRSACPASAVAMAKTLL